MGETCDGVFYVLEDDAEMAICKKLYSYVRRKGKSVTSSAYWEKSLTGRGQNVLIFIKEYL